MSPEYPELLSPTVPKIHRKSSLSCKENSLRGTIIFWIKLALGSSSFTFPYMFKTFGVFAATLFSCSAGYLNYKCCLNIFEANEQYHATSYPKLVGIWLGRRFGVVFQWILTLDLYFTTLCDVIVSWSFFKYILFFTGWGMPHYYQWISDSRSLDFDESHPQIVLIRFLYFSALFAVSLPLFCKSELYSFRFITKGFLFCFFALTGWVVIESPCNFDSRGGAPGNSIEFLWKKPRGDWPDLGFYLMSNFSAQVFLFTLIGRLRHPTQTRLQRVSRVAILSVLATAVVVGASVYIALGDLYTPVFLPLRKPPLGFQVGEPLFRLLIFFYFVALVGGLAVNMVALRDVMRPILKVRPTERNVKAQAILVLGSLVVLGFLVPDIIEIGTLTNTLLSSWDSYTVPIVLKLALLAKQGKSGLHKAPHVLLLLGINAMVVYSFGCRLGRLLYGG